MEVLLEWAKLETDFLVMSAETISGLQDSAPKDKGVIPWAAAPVKRAPDNPRPRTFFTGEQSTSASCAACKGSHPIWKCSELKSMPVNKRWNIVRRSQLCFRC